MPTTTTESVERTGRSRRGLRLKVAIAIAGAVLTAAALIGWHLWTDRQPTIYSAIDAYTSAVESGE